MTKYSKLNIVYLLQRWMDSVPGQTFLNYSYSWGASVVILGALFKLTHLPGANIMLYVGMGLEAFVFFLSGFDRPFDKTADGRDIPTHLPETEEDEENADNEEAATTPQTAGGIYIVGGGYAGGVSQQGGNSETATENESATPNEQVAVTQKGNLAAQVAAIGTPAWVGEQQQVSPEMAEATSHYVEELNKLTELLGKVSEQSMRLTRDSEEMENLNRTLTGICKVYEMQLKSASQQIGTIDQINDQSRKMAQQIEQLNRIYARMIEAMTVNMSAATGNINPQSNPIQP